MTEFGEYEFVMRLPCPTCSGAAHVRFREVRTELRGERDATIRAHLVGVYHDREPERCGWATA